MFDNIINLNKYLKPRIIENMNPGNKRSFESNKKIDQSMLVDSITKLLTNVSSDVIQNNSVSAASAAGSSNTLFISNVQCDDVSITGVKQGAESTNQTNVQSSQSNTSKMSTDISSNIDTTIQKVVSTDLDKS